MLVSALRILLADPHTLFRAGLRALIESVEDFHVVAEATDGQHALTIVEEQRPDVALMDVALPGLNGIEVTTRVRKRAPACNVILMSMQRDDDHVRRSLRAGCAGFLVKDAGFAEVELAVRAAARGEAYLSPAVAKFVIREFVHLENGSTTAVDLTARQREILQLIAEGVTTKETARRLGLNVKTVENHRADLMKRLDIHDIAGLVRYAVRTGVVPAG
jgi:DNA-binding NarL/FixJ family response regulator